MTELKSGTSQRARVLGEAPVSVNLKIPAPIYAALQEAAAGEYESIPATIRRMVVSGLRDVGLVE